MGSGSPIEDAGFRFDRRAPNQLPNGCVRIGAAVVLAFVALRCESGEPTWTA